MKLNIYSIFCLLIFLSSTCKKEGDNCHKNIIIKNNSAYTVLYALRFTTGVTNTKCFLEGFNLTPNETVKYDSKYCWEDKLSNGKTVEFYIVDPIKYNTKPFYNCDSIEIKNKVLKHYVLTLNDLKRDDFMVIYKP